MRAIVLATGWRRDRLLAGGPRIPPLMPLVDRPWLQHLVERLAAEGFTTLDLVLSRRPEQVERLLGHGRRWGVSIRHHLARRPARPWTVAGRLLARAAGPVLVASAHALPQAPVGRPAADPAAGPVVWLDPGGKPCGWAWLGPSQAGAVEPEAGVSELWEALAALPGAALPPAGLVLSAADYSGLLEAQRLVLAGEFRGLLLSGREVEPGVWLSRNVVLHPTASIRPPVHLGQDVRVERGAVVGPHAVVGRGCVLAEGCQVSRSLLLPASYVGPDLELDQAVVDGGRLVSPRLGAEVELSEPFLLGSLSGRRQGWLRRLPGRALAAGLLVAAAPALGLLRLGGRSWRHRAVLRQPLAAEPSQWHGFRLHSLAPPGRALTPAQDLAWRFLPGLVNVVRGELSLVGLAPRSAAEAAALPRERRALVHRTKAGLVSEALVCFGPSPDPDQLYAAETYYSRLGGWRRDLGLLARYLAAGLGLRRPSGVWPCR
jgi:hypothetical protein